MVMRSAQGHTGKVKPVAQRLEPRTKVSISPRRNGNTLYLRVSGKVRVANVPNDIRNCSFYQQHDGPVVVVFGQFKIAFNGGETEEDFTRAYNSWRPDRKQPVDRHTIINVPR